MYLVNPGVRRTEMRVRTNLRNWLAMSVFLLGLVTNVSGQISTDPTEDFETGDFSKFSWEHPGDVSWTITSSQWHSGRYGAQADTIEDDESATLQVTLDCAAGNITFYRKVSSESGFDFLKFYIDGVEQDKWSGEEDWAEVSFPVMAGTRIFEWTYSKDGSVSEYDDTAWIDDIVFPLVGNSEPQTPSPDGLIMEGDLVMGEGYADSLYETSLLRFTVEQADIGKYFHFSAITNGPLALFAVRGDRDGNKRDFGASDGLLSVARVVNPYVNPQMEFRAFAAGDYTLVFKSHIYEDPNSWRQEYVAPSRMSVHYRVTKTDYSPAWAEGNSIYILESTFHDTFKIDGEEVQKSSFDFTSYQAALNDVFMKYTELFGYDYTVYGTMVGVRYAGDPDYRYGGDASSPINVNKDYFVPTERVQAPSVFTHELGHVFTLGYPFVYSFDSANNVEAAANYPRDWLADPIGGGGLSHDRFIRHQAKLMARLREIDSSTSWYIALKNDGFLLFVKNISGSWDGIQAVFKSYSHEYNGKESNIDGYVRAEEFFLKLAESIPDEEKRNAFYAQLNYWQCPFAPNISFIDYDGDGIVSGIDPDDFDPMINPYSYEFIEDGMDNNLNGYVDELVLKMAGETITLGDDNTSYDTDRGTRRRIFLNAGQTINISVSSRGKPVRIGIYKGNILAEGPEWWPVIADEHPLVAQSPTVVNPSIELTIAESSVYTVSFTGKKQHGVEVGDEIDYQLLYGYDDTTDPTPEKPAAPTLKFPPYGATAVATDPTLVWWAMSPGHFTYRVQLSSSQDFSTILLDESGIATDSFIISNLSINTEYFWRVNATNEGGTSDWSDILHFDTIPLQSIIHVPGDFPTIQQALDVAAPGVSIIVAPGLYKETIRMKTGVSLIGSGFADTIIDGQGIGNERGSVVIGEEDSLITGFTIRNANLNHSNNLGAGIDCGVATFSIYGNRITNCRIGISIQGSPVIERNVIINNLGLAGIAINGSGTPIIINNTIVNNARGVQFSQNTTPDIVNNIIVGNRVGIINFGNTILSVKYNDIFGNNVNYDSLDDQTGLNGNVSVDPRFVDPEAEDYHLLEDSPCIDAGDPTTLDLDGTVADIGRFAFDPS